MKPIHYTIEQQTIMTEHLEEGMGMVMDAVRIYHLRLFVIDLITDFAFDTCHREKCGFHCIRSTKIIYRESSIGKFLPSRVY